MITDRKVYKLRRSRKIMEKELEKLFDNEGVFVSVFGEVRNPKPIGRPFLIHQYEFEKTPIDLGREVVESFLKKISVENKSEINAYSLGTNIYVDKKGSKKTISVYPIQFYKI